MENEIEYLKNIYLSTEIPTGLLESGYADVLSQIEEKRKPFYFSPVFLTVILLLILSTAFVGLTVASQPNTVFYSVKASFNGAISQILQKNPSSGISVQKFIPLMKATQTPSPVPTKIPTHAESKNGNSPTRTQQQTNRTKQYPLPTQDVKGVSTQKNNMNKNLQKESIPVNQNSQSNMNEKSNH